MESATPPASCIVSGWRVRTKPLARRTRLRGGLKQVWWCCRSVGGHRKEFCDPTTSTDAGRASAPYCTADTVRGYIHAVKEYAEYFGKSPELMGAEEVREFQLYMIRDKKLALGTVALRMGALRFLYKKTLRRRDIDIDDLPLVRAPKKLPVVLSQEEVVRLIEAAPNLHYRTLLMLL
jgi:Phage integrase, N-terminal SAM-like domain